MGLGRELSRLGMEQTVAEQAGHVPVEALVMPDDEVQQTGQEKTPLETEAGAIEWDQPRTRLTKGRKAF